MPEPISKSLKGLRLHAEVSRKRHRSFPNFPEAITGLPLIYCDVQEIIIGLSPYVIFILLKSEKERKMTSPKAALGLEKS